MTNTEIADPLQARALAAAQLFLAEYSGYEFANHGDERTHGEYVTLGQLSDGDVARNNCFIASSEIVEITEEDSFGGERAHVIAIANEDMYHAAIATWVEDDWYVIDFTARQFDPSLPFPFVAQQWDWKETIEAQADYEGTTLGFCKDAGNPASFEDEDAWSDDDWDDDESEDEDDPED